MNILGKICNSLISPHLETPNDAYQAMVTVAVSLSEDMTVVAALEIIDDTNFIKLAQRIFTLNRALDLPENAECFENCRLQVKQALAKLL